MTNHGEKYNPPKIRLWRYLPILIILGLAVHLILPQITVLKNSISVVEGLILWAVVFSVVIQVLSYLGSGYTLHAILSLNHRQLSPVQGALISLGSASVALVAGGMLAGSAATYGWLRRYSHDANTSALAGTLPAILNTAVLVCVAIIGTIYLIFVHELSSTQLIEFGVILLFLGLVTAGGIIALHSSEKTKQLAVRIAAFISKLRRKSFDPEDITSSVDNFVHAWNTLRKGNWLKPALGAAANIGFDMLTLYFLFIASGQPIGIGALFAGYGLPLILGRMAFFIPGGVGVVEGTMAAFYESLNISAPISVVVIIGYRLISFWTPTILGFAAAAYLSGKWFAPKR